MPLYHSRVYGIVQGVGFRPFVSRLAAEHGILGSVCNKGPFVEIWAQGTENSLRAFFDAIERRPPERAAVLKVETERLTKPECYTDFQIIESHRERGDIFVSPDIATCDTCRAELFDPKNRRYLHPFINCTACGPRLTIMDAMPYDRERTSMKAFPMCPECRAEYENPATRRYDAQPVCCNDCGPEVYLLEDPSVRGQEAITRVRRTIAEGGIAAIKGIGGFHLCCDATNETAVSRLRTLKHRPVKPFAVMLRDFDVVTRECVVEPHEKEIILGHQKPILLLKKKPGGKIAPSAAPGAPSLGVMLPYAPVQMLLFTYPVDDVNMPDALIMTSGNPSGAPICRNDDDARENLTGFTDTILSHNRPILIRSDDSVMDFAAGEPYMIRRSRGFAPLPVFVKSDWKGEVLGIGGELKNTFCLGHGSLFYPSSYVGDMSDVRTVKALRESVTRMETLLETQPSIVSCDLHPRYHTAQVARGLGLPVFPVQHHYAHIVSCLAENDCHEPVIGVSFDGTGYGTDGTIWGGEILRADYAGFTRLGSLEPFLQAGGDKSSTEGWRIALAFLFALEGPEQAKKTADRLQLCTDREFNGLQFMLTHQVNCITSTSAGRLFDGVSALLGIRTRSTFEGEAAMFLQFAADDWGNTHSADMPSLPALLTSDDGRFLLPTKAMFRELLDLHLAGEDTGALAWLFHAKLAAAIVAGCEQARRGTGLSTAALSGGVFQNTLLLHLVTESLKARGFTVLRHRLIPPNDGGICLGQAAAAMYAINNL